MNVPRTTSPAGGPLRIAIYTRVSTDDQERDGISLEEQPQLVRQYLDRKRRAGSYQVVMEVKDAGLSGSYGPDTVAINPATNTLIPKRGKCRPGLAQIFEAALDNEIDAVAVYNVSRLYRDQLAQMNFIGHLLKPRGMLLLS